MAQKGLTCLVLGLENMGIVDRIFRMFVAENKMQEKAKKKKFQFPVLTLEENKNKEK